MKLSEHQIRKIIQEEIGSFMNEAGGLDALRQRAGSSSGGGMGKKIGSMAKKGATAMAKGAAKGAMAGGGIAKNAAGGIGKSIGAAFSDYSQGQGYDGGTNLGDPSSIKNAQSDVERILKFMTTNKQVQPLVQKISKHPLKKIQFINQMMQWMKVPIEDLSKIQAKVKAQMKTNQPAEQPVAEEQK